MITVRLPHDLEARLNVLKQKTGKTKSSLIREALEQRLEEMEDVFLAENRFRTLAETIPLNKLINQSR